MKIRLATSNKYKVSEAQSMLSGGIIELVPVDIKIEELQTFDERKLVTDKLVKAFQIIGRPVIVEHTGLYLDYLNNFPAGLTQTFWDSLEADRFAEIIGNLPDNKATAKTILAYCDGARIHIFEGEIKGTIAEIPKGPKGFQWDCVFIPEGETETFAEIGTIRKNAISMRKKAYDLFLEHITKSKK